MTKKIIFILIGLFVSLLTTKAQPIEEIQKLLAGDGGVDNYFGCSVSIFGDYAIVGAVGNDGNVNISGSAYIFYNNSGTWEQQAKLTASDGEALDFFGKAVDIYDNYAVVGSVFNDQNGSVYIFKKPENGWTDMTETTKLIVSEPDEGGHFGWSFSIIENYIIVGDPVDDNSFDSAGAAYIFYNNSGTWELQAKLIASDGAFCDKFGISVDISGNNAIVGACENDDNGINSGSAYIFYNNSGTWEQQTKLTASDAAEGDHFGNSVSISNDYAIIGAHRDDDSGNSSGSAYIFYNNTGTWEQQDKLTASDASENDLFGVTVNISNDYIIIGASGDEDNGASSGSAYIFYNNSGTWEQQTKLTASDAAEGDQFGTAVNISDDYVIVGASKNTDNGNNSGSAYIFGSNNSVIKILTEKITIYPNPTNGKINFEFANNNIHQIQISNLTGKTIIKKTEIQQNEIIDLSNFESGIYIISIHADKEIFTTKIVKE